MLDCEELVEVGQLSTQHSVISISAPKPRIFTAKDAEVAKENRKAFWEAKPSSSRVGFRRFARDKRKNQLRSGQEEEKNQPENMSPAEPQFSRLGETF